MSRTIKVIIVLGITSREMGMGCVVSNSKTEKSEAMKKHILKVWLVMVMSLMAGGVWGQAPVVVSMSPVNGAGEVPVDKVLRLEFDMDVTPRGGKYLSDGYISINLNDASSVITFWSFNGKFHTKEVYYDEEEEDDVEVYFEVDSDIIAIENGNILRINLSDNFEYEQSYYVTIGNRAIYSTQGTAASYAFAGFASSTFWRFTTKSEFSPVDPPFIIENGYFPTPGATEVACDTELRLTFNEAIEFGDLNALFLIHRNGSVRPLLPGSEEVSISVNELELIVDLSESPLTKYNTDYYVLIESGFVKSKATGVDFPGISNATEWTFTTETAPPAWVDGYPNISNQTVDDFQLDVWADVTGAFYGVLTQSSTQPTAEQIAQGQNSGGSAARIAFNQVVNSIETFSSIGVDFNDQTLWGQSYFLHLVYRSGGTYPKYGEIKTIEIDRIIPTVEKTYPANNSMVFPAPDAIEITFSELVVGTDGEALSDAYFSLVQNSDPEVPIPFVISIVADGERTVITLTPTGGLVDNTAYTLTIKTVYDLSGNSSAASTIYFETDGIAQWTGTHDSNWNEPDNWGGTLPVDGKSVLIPGSLTNYPLITS
ncbi:MAG TPA: hypothetical protein DDW62_10250, partial [Marinilabiliaceae bacterium]|nr:hypothetical protein [Marinilabiliaceae bacterium]